MSEPDGWIEALAASPAWLCHELDLLAGQALFVRVDAETCRRSLFLDHRLAVREPQRRAAPLDPLVDGLADCSLRPARWIFHMGHCGSTLLSRLLEELNPKLLALREPLPLLTLAALQRQLDDPLSPCDPARYPALERAVTLLLSRRFEPSEATLVKATSDCLALAPALLGAHPGSRGLVMGLTLERYLEVMLRNDVRRSESRGHAAGRLADLRAWTGDDALRIYALSPGELAAMNWISLRLGADRAVAAGCRYVDFDRFLDAPAEALAAAAAHLGLASGEAAVARALRSPVAGHYAKDPAQPFSAADRQAQLADSARRHAAEIAAGLALGERLARRFGLSDPAG